MAAGPRNPPETPYHGQIIVEGSTVWIWDDGRWRLMAQSGSTGSGATDPVVIGVAAAPVPSMLLPAIGKRHGR